MTYVNSETGETYKNASERHKWLQTNSHTWECEKCECKKIQIDKTDYTYIMCETEFKLAPRCNNSKLINYEKQEEARQLNFNWW